MGLRSKSSGNGNERRLTIYKRRFNKSEFKTIPAVEKKKLDKLKCVSFPTETKPLLQELFTRYPPCDGDTLGTSMGIYAGRVGNQRKSKDDFFSKPQLSKEEIVKKAVATSSRLLKDKAFQEILNARTKLPIFNFKDAVTSAVESNQVVLIAGETGCGKTTQVPQYLLDHMWYTKKESCKIICTQPRRISAISVSERMAWERGESIGNNIGYKVRLESKGGRQSSVIFCTNGILLRVLIGKGSGSSISNITHIIVDEIHERDCYSDFMLAIIRDFLPSNPHIRLILMSATLDAERFSGYFGGCPVVRVPGFTHPVRTFYLEDALSLLEPDTNVPDSSLDIKDEDKVALDEAIDLAWKDDDFDPLLDIISSEPSHEVYNYRQTSTWLTPLMVFAGKGRVSDVCKLLLLGADCKLKSKEGMRALELAEKENQLEAAKIIKEHADNFQSNSQQSQDLLDKYMSSSNPEEVDVGLIARLVKKICSDSEAGAILVFLPGWDEISKTRERFLANPYFASTAKFSIMCLHSRVPVEEQKRVFIRPPKGCRKIVLATNIAESAVTIDDVIYVIDSGRLKEKSYDPYNDVSTLQSSWVSKANAKQREGRAGRCQPGICYHLYSKLRASSLPDYRVPEVRRMPVDELCLQVKMLDPCCDVNIFLQKLMDPPLDKSIANALTTLKDIGALTPQEELTELGQKFGQLPVHPRISKMLYFAVLVSCLDAALIMACAIDAKSPFTMPIGLGERKKAADAKRELASLYGGYSDHLAVVAAYYCWKSAKKNHESKEFCSRYFVSPNAMKILNNMRKKLQGELERYGLIPKEVSKCNVNSHNPGILRAVIAVGLYPMVGKMCRINKQSSRFLVETITGAKVRLLSNNLKTKNDDLIVFDEITRGDWDVHIRSCTALPILPLLLFSGEIAVAPTDSSDGDKTDDEEDHEREHVGEDVMDVDKAVVVDIDKADGSRPGEKVMLAAENKVQVVVDRWLSFKITAFEIAQMYILRERLIASILFMVKHPQKKLPPRLDASMYAITCILSCDGLLKPRAETVAVEPTASVVAVDAPSDNASGNQENDTNTAAQQPKKKKKKKKKPKSKKRKLDNKLDGNVEESLPSDPVHGNQQCDPSNALTEAVASVVKEPEKLPCDIASGNEQTELKSARGSDFGNKEESLLSNQQINPNGNQESEANTVPMEAAGSAAQQPKKKKKKSKSKKQKLDNNLDSGNKEEKLPCDMPSGNEETELKLAKVLDFGNVEESLPSDPVHGIQQSDPNNALTEAVSSVVKEPENLRSDGNEKTELKPGNMEESLPSNQQTDPNTAPEKKRSRRDRKKQKLAEENKSSDVAIGNEETEVKLASKVEESGKEKESIPSEQRDAKTALMEIDSAAKPPKNKRSKSKKRKLSADVEEKQPINTLLAVAEKQNIEETINPINTVFAEADNQNIEETTLSKYNMDSTDGNKQPINSDPSEAASMAEQPINTDLPEAASMAEKQNIEVQVEPNPANN